MTRFACKSCGYVPKLKPKEGSWTCPKCRKSINIRKKATSRLPKSLPIKRDPEIEELTKPLDRTYMPPPRESLYLFYSGKKEKH